MLNQSPLFTETLQGNAPRVDYYVNEQQYKKGYYLADGIYPEWAVFVKTIPLPQTEKTNSLPRDKKVRERMLNVHLEFYNNASKLWQNHHDFGIK